jgi:hypothetical protein
MNQAAKAILHDRITNQCTFSIQPFRKNVFHFNHIPFHTTIPLHLHGVNDNEIPDTYAYVGDAANVKMGGIWECVPKYAKVLDVAFSVQKKVGLRPTWNGGYESVAPFRVVSVNANVECEETIDFAQNIESMIWQDKGVRIEFWAPRSPTESDVCVLIVSLHMTVLAKLHEQLESKAENWRKWNPLNFTGKSFVESEYYLKYFSALISANEEMESDS